MTPPSSSHPPTHTHNGQWGFVDFKMAANENALKLELGISGIIHNVFQGDQTAKQIFKKKFGKKLIIFHGRGAGGTPPWKIPWK